MSGKLLLDNRPIKLSVEEAKNGKLIARGEYARCDVPTQNKRIYSRKIYEREVGRLADDIANSRLVGELDHPADGKTKLQRASHVIRELHIEDDGRVIGASEILDTPNGRTLAALLKAGVEVGVSSRGFGSVAPTESGGDMVGEDFVLKTFDFVADPAMKTAYPEIFSEDVDADFNIEAIKEDLPEVYKSIEENLLDRAEKKASEKFDKSREELISATEARVRDEERAKYEGDLIGQLAEIREDIASEIREEFAADPNVGASTAVLAQIAELVSAFKVEPDKDVVSDALKERDTEIDRLKEELDEFKRIAKKAGYRLHVEQKIAGHPAAATIRSLMSEAHELGSLAEVEKRLGVIMEDLIDFVPPEQDVVSEEVEALEEANEKLSRKAKRLEGQVTELDRKLRKAVDIGETLTTRLEESEEKVEELEDRLEEAKLDAYKEKKVAGLSNGRSLISLLEGVKTRKDVDRLVDKEGSKGMSDAVLESVRQKIQRGVSEEPEPLTEVKSPGGGASVVEGLSVLGLNLDEQQKLAGAE